MYRGGTVVIMPKFSAEAFLDEVSRNRVTHVFLVPTQTIQIVNHDAFATADLSSLANIISAGQPLDRNVFERVVGALPGAKLWDAYGLSEGFCTLAGPADWAKGKFGSVGKAFILDDIRIIDGDEEVQQGRTGEICGYSVGNMKGYYRDPERTKEMVWQGHNARAYLRSGDLGRIDEDGYLYIQGRKKDMIKSGGINVFPVDIESVFMQHPAVAEACAIGIPHDKWIETPLLFVVLRPNADVTADALMEWGNERLGKFQRVSGITFLEDLPRITYGKVDKNRLRAPFWTTDETGKVIPVPR
jgi:acyl-CoA synthetase (AMP-forming)/AMP-acid ligase II